MRASAFLFRSPLERSSRLALLGSLFSARSFAVRKLQALLAARGSVGKLSAHALGSSARAHDAHQLTTLSKARSSPPQSRERLLLKYHNWRRPAEGSPLQHERAMPRIGRDDRDTEF